MRNNEKREMETDLRSVLRIEIELCFLISLIQYHLRACSRGREVPGRASNPGALGEVNGLNMR